MRYERNLLNDPLPKDINYDNPHYSFLKKK